MTGDQILVTVLAAVGAWRIATIAWDIANAATSDPDDDTERIAALGADLGVKPTQDLAEHVAWSVAILAHRWNCSCRTVIDLMFEADLGHAYRDLIDQAIETHRG